MRLSLRTSVYQEALGRMLGVMRVVQLYEIDETIKSRADSLISEMKRHNAASGGYHVSQMVERRALEILVYRFVDEARFAKHPLTTSPKDFLADMGIVLRRQRHAGRQGLPPWRRACSC